MNQLGFIFWVKYDVTLTLTLSNCFEKSTTHNLCGAKKCGVKTLPVGTKKIVGRKKNLWGQTSSVYFISKSSLLEDRHMNAMWGQIGMEPKMWGQNSVGSKNVG